MSALDDAVSLVADELKVAWGEDARAELTALLAELVECKRPKTCAGCKWLEQKGFMGNDYCLNENSPVLDFQQGFTITPDTFGCIHWEPAPGSGGGEGG